jgi:ferric-dicitrate binding protein FerR (iron transport regulator)
MNACKKAQTLLFEKADGRLAGDERAQVDAHLAICPHCQQTFASWSSALPRLRGLAKHAEEAEISAVSLRRMEGEILRGLQVAARPRSRRTLVWALAAGLVLAVGAGSWSMRTPIAQPFARIQTTWGRVTLSGVAMTKGAAMGPGGVLEIAAEGEAAFVVGRETEVRLAGPGRVAFDGTTKEPRLRLDSGQVFVHVAHRKADEHFRVDTADGRVEVRGTRFVVGYSGRGSYVHVDEGVVMAFRHDEPKGYAVGAGETFAFNVDQPAPSALPAADTKPPEPQACAGAVCEQGAALIRKTMRAGNHLRALEMVDEALAQVDRCLPTARCLDELGYLRAEALRQAGRLDGAVVAFKSLNRAGATRAMRQNALFAAAHLERRLGRNADARQSLERAYAANPDGALAEEALAGLLDLFDSTSAGAKAAAERYMARYPQGMAAARARRILSPPLQPR